jgi:hypothetical protein
VRKNLVRKTLTREVFISYASNDLPAAEAVCAGLESEGYSCWMAPRDVTPGMDWSEQIVEALFHAGVVVLVLSSDANNSHQVKREIERAVSTGRAVIPFRIEDVPPSKSLAFFISTSHWLDAISPPLERHLPRLIAAVRSHLLSQLDATNTFPIVVKEIITEGNESTLGKDDDVSRCRIVLRVMEAGGHTWNIPVPTDEDTIFTIGRGADNTLILKDGHVSRRHAFIRRRLDDGEYEIVDGAINSATGTLTRSAKGIFVSGRRLFRASLNNGTVIQIGNSQIVVMKLD